MRFAILLLVTTFIFLTSIVVLSLEAQPDLPSSFDLRDVAGENYVTSIKMQTGGTCWTHGAMAAIESNLLMTDVWDAAGEEGEPNLAEYHLDWWNGFNEYNNDDTDPPFGGGLTVHEGGDYMVTSAYLARSEGAVRDIDGQSYDYAPDRYDSSYHFYYVHDVEWYVAGEDLSNINAIKQTIMEKGALATCMSTNWEYFSDCTLYQPPSTTDDPTHAIAIIGWDDDRATQAPQPGAWLCKNSWGENWCNDGYFWISYYDKHCGQHPQMGAVSFQGVQPQAYDRIYYHDYHGWRDTFTECTEAFNVFVAAGQELLKAVSFFTAANDVTYTIRIYARFDGSELEIELATKSGVIEQIGFHTIELDEDIPLSPDDSFYVYLDLSGGGHAYDRTSEVPVLLGARYRTLVESSSNPGESFYKSGSVWYDLYEYNHSANFCLKALVVNNPSIMLILPEGAPGVIEPAAPTEIAVDIIDGNESYVPGTGMIHYRFDEGIYVSSPLTPAGGDTYLGTLPAVTCDAIPEFYFSGQGDGGSTVFSPIGAPDHFYEALVGTLLVSIEDNFEEDLGWIVWNVEATSGIWERCVPLVTSPPYYSPFTDSDGSGMCYVTDNESDSDVNDGAVRLMSPTFDMSDRQVIRYDYYLYLSDEISGNDVLLIEINNTSGVGDWFEVDAHDTHGQWNWRSHQITASDITGAGVSLTSTMRIRFTINDADPQSIVEAGIDAFSVADIACEAVYPDAPVLLTPLNGSAIRDSRPEFSWSHTVDSGGEYTLQYSQDETFETGAVTIPGLTSENFTPTAGEELDVGVWYWHVQARSIYGYSSGYQDTPHSFTLEAWVCGDTDGSGEVDIDDAVSLINYIFGSGSAPDPYEAGDPDCSGAIDIDDVVYLISYIFSGGYAPCDPDGDEVPDC